MFTKLMAGLIAAVLVFGVAATASAAQSSLPMDALYPIKTMSESVKLGLSFSATDKLDKALEHARSRVEEMAALAEMGVNLPEQVGADQAKGVEFAFRLAAKMPEAEMAQALEKIHQSLQEQLAAVALLRAARPDDVQLASVEGQLQHQIDLVELGLSNPQAFREQVAALLQGTGGPTITQEPSSTEKPAVTETPPPSDDNSNDANSNDANSNDANANDGNANGNTNDDNGNANDDNGNANANDDNGNANANDDNGNANANDDNGNANANDDNGNGNANDDNGNGNTNDDNGNGNANDDNSNGNANDDNGNGNANDDNGGGHGGNSNDHDDNGKSGSAGVILNSFFTFVIRVLPM